MSHVVISGIQLTGEHPNLDEALAAAISQAKQGRVVQVAQVVKTVAPNTGVTVTDAASGQTEVVK